MIITKLQGGLGNQMFQYAIGRNLALKNKTDLKLDISHYRNFKDRNYTLGKFKIVENIATDKERLCFNKYKPNHTKFIGKIYNSLFSDGNKYVVEKYFRFDTSILTLKKDFYLDGFWQTEKYFDEIEQIIRKEFTLKNELSKEALEWLEKIQGNNSVSIHIRRGDYANDVITNKYWGTCPLEYYTNAIRLIEEKITEPVFFVFSDDIEWAKKNLKTKEKIYYVSNQNIQDYEEMILMSKCYDNIIANSTFSWWAGWLNENSNKIIIAPKKWSLNTKIDPVDLLPDNWIKI